MTEARDHPEIGPARRDELPAVALLAASCLREAWSEAGYAAILEQPGVMLRVARDVRGGVSGFLLAQLVEDELNVLSLAVALRCRRLGVARALFENALGECLARHVFLEVRPSNAAARAFYGAQGFAVVGVRRGYYPDGEDALLLARRAAAPSSAKEARS